MVDILGLLKQWTDVTQYDSEAHRFNLFSSTYEFHRVGKRIEKLLQFDSTGVFALMYAKCSFETIIKGMKCSLLDLCQHPDAVKSYQDLWAAFNSTEMIKFEEDTIQSIIESTNIRPAIGKLQLNDEVDRFRDSIEYVAEELTDCKTDIYSTGTAGSSISNKLHMSKTLHVFNTTSECILKLERSPDGMYLCYVSEFNSCGGYFGYFIKCGKILLSLNDRIAERFVGEHTNSRNNRFIESKKWHIFPYNDIISAEGSDYKGYAKSLVCEVKPYNIAEFSSDTIYRVMLSMSLVLARYRGREITAIEQDPQTRVVYVDSLLPHNLNSSEMKALVPTQADSVILHNHEHVFHSLVTSEDVANNMYQKVFNRSNENKTFTEKGFYTSINEELVREYGHDFVLNYDEILKRSWPQLTSGESHIKDASDVVVSEYIATENQMQLEWYRQARMQLKDHIVKKLREDAQAAGGTEAIRNWYIEAIHTNREYFKTAAIQWYAKHLNGEVDSRPIEAGGVWCTTDPVVSIKTGPQGFDNYKLTPECILNEPKTYQVSRWGRTTPNVETYRSYNEDTTANMWFIFAPSSYAHLQDYVGKDRPLPHILKYWIYNDDRYCGNPLIDSCDPVGFIRNPFAYMTHYERTQLGFNEFTDLMFTVGIGFSKHELNKLMKDNQLSR